MLCSTIFGGKDESIYASSPCMGHHERLRFLVVLDKDEFLQSSCWFLYNKIDTILQNARWFPGKIEVLSTDQLIPSIHRFTPLRNISNAQSATLSPLITDKYKQHNQTSHIYEKNRVYVRIPKEKMYVLLEDFTKIWVSSQLNELNVLFLHLNAEIVKIKRVSENPHIELSLVGIHPGVDEYIGAMGANDHECVEIQYPLIIQQQTFNPCKYFYYNKWKPMVENRKKEGKYYDNFVFSYKRPAFLNEMFFKELRTWGLQASYTEEIDEFELHFEIFYYTDEMIENNEINE
jgi:hypothetical protein